MIGPGLPADGAQLTKPSVWLHPFPEAMPTESVMELTWDRVQQFGGRSGYGNNVEPDIQGGAWNPWKNLNFLLCFSSNQSKEKKFSHHVTWQYLHSEQGWVPMHLNNMIFFFF